MVTLRVERSGWPCSSSCPALPITLVIAYLLSLFLRLLNSANLHYYRILFNLCIAPALADSNGLLYVTKSYNSHSVRSLGQRLELFFNKLFSYFPLYFHLNFARGTVTIWINYFYKDKVTTLWNGHFSAGEPYPLIITPVVTSRFANRTSANLISKKSIHIPGASIHTRMCILNRLW